MWTNKNTPLIWAVGIAGVFVGIGILLNTPITIGISLVLAILLVMTGFLSRRMTHLWLTDDVRLWARHILQFEREDQQHMPAPKQIVFAGSSTIRYWKTLAEDMAPLPTVRRGFGGSRILDAIYYADRIIIPYDPSAVVLFSGTNDLAGKTAKTADYVAEKFRGFCAVVHAALPDVPIYYISILPTPGRKAHWQAVQQANRLIQEYTQSDDRLHFIDAVAPFLDNDQQPKRDLFRRDRIHLSSKGYEVLTEIVKPQLLLV